MTRRRADAAPDELFAVVDEVLAGIAHARDELGVGEQFDPDGSYTTLAHALTGDLGRITARLHRWCRTHGLEAARRVWVRLTQGRAGTLRRTGLRFYRNPGTTSSASMPDYLAAYVDRIPAAAARLRGVSLECEPALEVISEYGRHRGVLIYADPPYLGTVRTASQYRCEMPSDHDHRALADALHACAATVVLSGYPCALYDELYHGWHREEILPSPAKPTPMAAAPKCSGPTNPSPPASPIPPDAAREETNTMHDTTIGNLTADTQPAL